MGIYNKNKYDKPMSLAEIKRVHGKDIHDRLASDPAHKWRADSGIELIHKEPSINEQKRIWKNWQAMPNNLKKISDEKSIELYGINNADHNKQIMEEYNRDGIKESSISDTADEWEKDANSELVGDDSDNLSELEQEKNKYDMQPKKQRRVADWKSEELYGKTNSDRYNELKDGYLKDVNNFEDEYGDKEITAESSVSSSGNYEIGEEDEYNTLEDDPTNETPDYDSATLKEAISWCTNTMISMILPTETIVQLEDSFIKWRSMTRKHQRDSDNKSIELFQMNNMDHYNYLKNKFIGNKDASISYDDITVLDVSDKAEEIEKIQDDIKAKYALEGISDLEVGAALLKLNSIKTDTILESVTLQTAVAGIERIHDNLHSPAYDMTPSQLPYFSFNEIKSKLETVESYMYEYEGLNATISLKDWESSYFLLCNGVVDCKMKEYIPLWITKVNELCIRLYKEKDEGARQHLKENILLLGWNPEIGFTTENRIKATKRCKSIISEMYKDSSSDLTKMVSNIEINTAIVTESGKDELYPIYIMLVYRATLAERVIKKYTDSVYSHAALSLDSSLRKLYSFNGDVNGFSLESISKYLKYNENSVMKLSCVFVKKADLDIIQSRIDDILINIRHTSYSFINILGVMLNKSIQMNYSMVCSQFVDYLFKSINVDLTSKPSGLVTPKDFQLINNNKVYTLYEGRMSEYDSAKIDSALRVLKKKALYIKENFSILNETQLINTLFENYNDINSMMCLDNKHDILNEDNKAIYDKYIKPSIDISYMNEVKEFPVQFDNDGNLLIKNKKNIDFEVEYSKSHKLLKIYDETDNVEGMKYEVSKLWFLNLLLEDSLYTKKSENADHRKVRARILNDFTKYTTIISKKDQTFNFTEYYNNTPFSDETMKINKSTLKYTGELLKKILTHILH